MEPISLQLMDPNCKPVHARAYTVPRSVEQQLHKISENVKIGFPIICNSKEKQKQNNKSFH
jgi:hypothetical protein